MAARGDRAEALARLRRIPRKVQDAELQRLRRLARQAEKCTICDARMILSNTPLAEAALLHTDAAWTAPAGGSHHCWQELERASELLDIARVFASGRAFALKWYRLAALGSHRRMDWSFGEWLADRGLARYKDDGELLLLEGTLLETVGWRGAVDKEARRYLGRAETALLQATLARADAPEPRLRLAHVRLLLGNTEESRAPLETLASSTEDETLRYLSALFLGSVLEEEEASARAAVAYRQAITLRPDDQAARVALGHSLFLSGDVSGARREVDEALARAGKRETDPFWRYPWGHTAEVEPRLERLRQEASRCCH